MASLLKGAVKRNLIKPEGFVDGGLQYEVITGSEAYGMSSGCSDVDVYGFCIPPKRIVFPHTVGYIAGFGTKPQGFDQWQKHHINDQEARKEYDFTIFSIVKYFQLTMMCNPNMIDTLFVPQRCVIYASGIGRLVRENRKIFLNKKAWHTFKGYSYAQVKKMNDKNPEGKRKEIIDKFGYDVKYASHIVRLLCEIEQILIEQNLDLERNSEQLKSIRRGEWTKEQVEDYFAKKEASLELTYANSKLPHTPREAEVKQLLINCLEEYYGSLSGCIEKPSDSNLILDEIEKILRKYR